MSRCFFFAVTWQVTALLSAVSSVAAEPPSPSSETLIRDGDRVVLLGGTFIERDNQFGELETALSLAAPGRDFSTRNLGWSGDTVWAESRGIFDPPHVGYQRMIDMVKELKPTLIILAYGLNESFAGQAGVPAFQEQYLKLCNDLKQATGARIGIFVPHLFPESVPQFHRLNANLIRYRQAIYDKNLGADWVMSLPSLPPRSPEKQATGNEPLYEGMHLTAAGYRQLSDELLKHWRHGSHTIDATSREKLRTAIVEKNMLFFHRWRPQNTTYLFGFRKHEQGNNAGEISAFNQLAIEADRKISEIRKQTAAMP